MWYTELETGLVQGGREKMILSIDKGLQSGSEKIVVLIIIGMKQSEKRVVLSAMWWKRRSVAQRIGGLGEIRLRE